MVIHNEESFERLLAGEKPKILSMVIMLMKNRSQDISLH
jgi:hypothetical protein